MKKTWNMVNLINTKTVTKNMLFILLMMILFGMVGGLLWAVIGRLFLPGLSWLFCFAGYPMIFGGIFGSVVYLYNHDFA